MDEKIREGIAKFIAHHIDFCLVGKTYHETALSIADQILCYLQSQGYCKIDEIAKNVKQFLMDHYLVTSGDKYRLNADDHKKLDKILKGE